MSDECGSPSGHWHEEVRLWSDAATTCRSSLAWCAWVRQVQTAWWCADARTTLLYSIWQHTGHQSLRLRHDNFFIWLPAIKWQFCDIDGLHMVVRHSLSLVCRRGTHCRNIYATILRVLLFSIIFFSQSTNVYSASEALARMQYINWHFTLHYCVLHT